jgi:RimJ/RimL family protein N-acetyltransferase
MRYKTDRIILEPFERRYTETNYKNWFIDQEIVEHNSHGLGYFTQKDIDSFLDSLHDGTKLVWAILSKEDKKCSTIEKDYHDPSRIKKTTITIPNSKCFHIGNISLQSINYINRSAEFAIIIGEKEYWGQGITTEAGNLVLYHGFDKLNLNRIWTGTSSTNIGMQKVAEKLGMKKEGVSRQGMYLNGVYVSVFHYGILKKEWENKFYY